MTAPRLNRQLTLETRIRTRDGAGGFRQTWHPLGVLWAEVKPLSGRETARSGVGYSTQSYRITLRASPVGQNDRPSADQRFRDGNRIYGITAVAEAGADGRYLICRATEETAT